MTTAVVLTNEDLERLISKALEPLRLEIERLRAERTSDPVPVPEAARRLGVSTRSVQRWIKANELQSVHIGGRQYVVLPGSERTE
jgi:excisionase family DNA binding protein